MRRSSLLATLALALFVAGTPVLVISRLAGGIMPIRELDLVIIAFVLAWVQLTTAILRRDDALDDLDQPRFSLRWQADKLVAQSLLGAGFAARPSALDDGLARIAAPADSVDALLPPAPSIPRVVQHDERPDPVHRITPTLTDDSNDGRPEVSATEAYVVARGDTFWSISEYLFGDGRHWKTVQELNLGREVAPGVVLNEDHEPRIGWSILIPVVEASEADEAVLETSH